MSNTVTTNRTRETKSLLAKLMAAEDINVEYRNNVSTAAFNTENRTLIMPIFKDVTDSTTDLFLGHEVGHALYTPQGAITEVMKKGRSYKSLVNIVEDARIEKMIQSKFPGLSRNFYDGYSELMDRNFFGLNGRDVSDLNLFDRINVHFKIGTRAGVEFTDAEQVFVDRISKLRHFDDTIAVTDDLLKFCEENDYDDEEDVDDETDEDDDGFATPGESEVDDDETSDGDNGETSDEPAEDSNSDASSDSDESNSNGEENSSADSKGETEEGDDDSEKTVGGNRGGVYDGQDSMISETMESFDDHLKDLVDTETEYKYARVPGIDLEKVIIPMAEWNALEDAHDALWESYEDQPTGSRISLAKEKFLKFRSENKSLVSYLAKEFEMRKTADEHKRTKVAKTGILNPNKLHSYKFNEDLFLRSEVITAGKNHGFIMYLDWSGSMHEDMGNTIDQLMLLALFCKKINVPFEAYAFTDRFGDEETRNRRGFYHEFSNPQINDIGVNSNFRLLHLVSSSLSTSKFQTSMTYLARLRMSFPDKHTSKRYESHSKLQLGGTPLGECIITAINMVPEFQKKNSVQIVNTIFLTDGQGHGDCSTWDGVEYETKYNGRSNIVVVDPVTKKHYGSAKNTYATIDDTLMKVLSDRTKARVIGFYIAPTKNKKRFNAEIGYSGIPFDSREGYWNDIKEKNFTVLENFKGYDQYIWVSSKSLNINTDEISIDSDMTKGRMKNAFVKQRQGKFGNKVMLSKLAEFVS